MWSRLEAKRGHVIRGSIHNRWQVQEPTLKRGIIDENRPIKGIRNDDIKDDLDSLDSSWHMIHHDASWTVLMDTSQGASSASGAGRFPSCQGVTHNWSAFSRLWGSNFASQNEMNGLKTPGFFAKAGRLVVAPPPSGQQWWQPQPNHCSGLTMASPLCWPRHPVGFHFAGSEALKSKVVQKACLLRTSLFKLSSSFSDTCKLNSTLISV